MIKVTAAIIEKDGKILIARRKKDDPLKDKWEFPGGKVEDNETPEECLRRELHEELGIDSKVGDFICASKYEYAHISIELLAYKVRYVSGEFKAYDHEELKWISPSDLVKYDFPEADKPIIKKLLKDIYHIDQS
jgi:8-oxo-dGTP diphosphatase